MIRWLTDIGLKAAFAFQSERKAAGPVGQRAVVEMEPNSTSVGNNMTTVTESIPIESTCSTCKTTEIDGMPTETISEFATEMTTGVASETRKTTRMGNTDYDTCQETKTEEKSQSTFNKRAFLSPVLFLAIKVRFLSRGMAWMKKIAKYKSRPP